MPPTGFPPEYEESQADEDISSGMEETIPQRIDLQIPHTIGGIAARSEHVVPLQDLVQHNPIEEAAQAQSEQDARRRGECGSLPIVVPFHCPFPGRMRSLIVQHLVLRWG